MHVAGESIFLCTRLPKDEDGSFLEDTLPAGNSRLDLLQHNQSDSGVSPEDQAAASSGSFRSLDRRWQQISKYVDPTVWDEVPSSLAET